MSEEQRKSEDILESYLKENKKIITTSKKPLTTR